MERAKYIDCLTYDPDCHKIKKTLNYLNED